MKGYFVLFGQSAEEQRDGVGLKIRNQIKVFNRASLNCKELVLPNGNNFLVPVLHRIPFFSVYPVWNYREEFSKANYLYMRRPLVMSGAMHAVLKQVRENNPSIKIIIEIPTYPYDKEYDKWKGKWFLIKKDSYYRNKMQGLINYYAVLDNRKKLFGVPTIKIGNGIDVSAIPKKQITKRDDNNTIHICAVAMFREWHGYERFIEGIKKYYENDGQKNIICHFVGEGPELPYYKHLVNINSLNNHFVFHNFLEGKELDKIYNLCTLSLGTFGRFKNNVFFSCDLKSREAMARGIPMVTGCPTDIFCNGFPYFLEFPNNSSILDINLIIDFHERIYKESESKVIDNIRNYAYQNINMEKSMENVINYFRS